MYKPKKYSATLYTPSSHRSSSLRQHNHADLDAHPRDLRLVDEVGVDGLVEDGFGGDVRGVERLAIRALVAVVAAQKEGFVRLLVLDVVPALLGC